MRISLRALLSLKVMVYSLWPVTAWATQITLANSLMAVPPLAWLMVFILSTVSGLASLLNSLKAEDSRHWLLLTTAHMLGSWLSGFIMFLIAEDTAVSDLMETVFIAIAAYSGAKLTEKASELMLSKVGK